MTHAGGGHVGEAEGRCGVGDEVLQVVVEEVLDCTTGVW